MAYIAPANVLDGTFSMIDKENNFLSTFIQRIEARYMQITGIEIRNLKPPL